MAFLRIFSQSMAIYQQSNNNKGKPYFRYSLYVGFRVKYPNEATG